MSGPASSAKVSGPVFNDEQCKQITRTAELCRESMRQHRGISWKDYAQKTGLIARHNFGVGQETAICCAICHRLLPVCLITLAPAGQSGNQAGLQDSIAFAKDHLLRSTYLRVLKLVADCYQGHALHADILAIHRYDDGLAQDVRNLEARCWHCNSRTKGQRGAFLPANQGMAIEEELY